MRVWRGKAAGYSEGTSVRTSPQDSPYNEVCSLWKNLTQKLSNVLESRADSCAEYIKQNWRRQMPPLRSGLILYPRRISRLTPSTCGPCAFRAPFHNARCDNPIQFRTRGDQFLVGRQETTNDVL